MQVDNLEVLIQANTDQFQSALQRVDNTLNVFARDMKKTQTQGNLMTVGISKSGIAIAAIAGAIGFATIKIVSAMANVVTSSTKASVDVVESESLVAVIFGNMTGKVTDWSENLQAKLGLNAIVLRKTAGIFFNMANSMGVSRDNAYKLSTGITLLSADLASFYNLSNDEAIQKLQSGITGEVKPLKDIGIVVDETTVKQTAYRLGIAQVGYELTNQQKVMARYMTILEQTKNAHGDLARTINSPANQMRILQARLQTLSISFGNIFIPILNRVLPYLNAIVIVLGRAVQAVISFLGVIGFKVMVTTAKDLSDQYAKVGDNAQSATEDTNALTKAVKGLASFDEMNVLPQAQGGNGQGGNLSPDTGYKLPDYAPDFAKIQDDATKIADQVQNWFGNAFNWVHDKWVFITTSIGTLWNTYIATPMRAFWDNILSPLFNFWGGIINLTIIPALLTIKGQFEDIFGFLVQHQDFFLNLFKTIAIIIGVTIVAAITLVIAVIGGIVLAFQGLLSVIQFVINIGKGYFDLWVKQLAGVITAVKNITDWFKSMYTIVSNIFTNVLNISTNVIDKIVSKISGLKTGFLTIANTIVTVIKAPLNTLIGLINDFIISLNKIKIPDWVPGLGGKGFNLSTIPKLATGGVVDSPTLAMIGEAGREVVLPLDKNTGWIQQIASEIKGQNASGQPIHLVVNLGGKTIYEDVIDYINDKAFQTNNKILVG